MAKKCSFKGCDKPVFVKKTDIGPLCNGHYKQYMQAKKAGQKPKLKELRKYKPKKEITNAKKCKWVNPKTEEQCERPTWGASDYCQSHERQKQAGEELHEIREYNFQIGKTCSKSNCKEPAKAKGLCAKHYSEMRIAKKIEQEKLDG